MALKTCPHCGHNVSDKATKCPQCGKYPRFTDFQLEQQEQQRKKKRKKNIIVSALVLVAALAAFCLVFIPRYIEQTRQTKAYNEERYCLDYEKFQRATKALKSQLGN